MNPITVPMDEPKPSCNTTLSTASHLTRSELLKRRFQHLYWHLMEHVKTLLYRHYLYHHALNPFSHFHLPTCAFLACKLKPMPLTSFCYFHILSDSNQKLYKPCNYVIKRAEDGPITCGKPIVPALCTVHSQKGHTLNRNSRKISSTTNMAPKFDALVYVKHIQGRRRKEIRENKSKIVVRRPNDGWFESYESGCRHNLI